MSARQEPALWACFCVTTDSTNRETNLEESSTRSRTGGRPKPFLIKRRSWLLSLIQIVALSPLSAMHQTGDQSSHRSVVTYEPTDGWSCFEQHDQPPLSISPSYCKITEGVYTFCKFEEFKVGIFQKF